MASLTINIPAEAEQRLREEAERRNATIEAYAASLIVDQLQSTQRPAEFEIGEEEIQAIQKAVSDVRGNVTR